MGLVLDAYPLIALLREEPIAREVAGLLARERTLIGAVNLAEAVDVLERRDGVARRDVEQAIGLLVPEVLGVAEVTAAHAWRAAGIRARHYRRGRSELSLADCFVIATAGTADSIATADGALARAARAEGIEVVALPDSRGRRP